MSSSMTGATGTPRQPTGQRTRGLNPGQKHIPGHHRFQQFTPEAMELYQQLFGMLGPDSYLQRLAGGDEELFNEIEAPALKQFSSQLGGLASRFSRGGGEGSLGSRKSSGFQNASNQAASDFAMQLQGQRQGLQRQALQDIMGYGNMLFGQQPYGLSETPRNPSFLDKWLGLAANTMGVAARGGMGGA